MWVQDQMTDKILKLSIVVSIVTYMLWKQALDYFGLHIFYIGIALSHFLLALYIERTTEKRFITFLLLAITLNNLLDELLFDNTKFGINEIIATVLIPIAYYLKSNNNA
jgi:hypothetical protein